MRAVTEKITDDFVVYKLPKEKLIYGPMLIEQRINQDTDISREITLWDQRGSDVIRGNLLVIPIRNSFIYVEPLYLRASQHGMPGLKRVLAVHGDRLAMAKISTMPSTGFLPKQRACEFGIGI